MVTLEMSQVHQLMAMLPMLTATIGLLSDSILLHLPECCADAE